jgi:hypothetical protein
VGRALTNPSVTQALGLMTAMTFAGIANARVDAHGDALILRMLASSTHLAQLRDPLCSSLGLLGLVLLMLAEI